MQQNLLLRLFRTELWLADIVSLTTDAIMKPFRGALNRIAKAGRRSANDDDPFAADFEAKAGTRDADPFSGEPYGDVPWMGQRDRDSETGKKSE